MSRGAWAPSTRRRRSGICGSRGCTETAGPSGFCDEHREVLNRVKAELDAEAEKRSYNSRARRKPEPEDDAGVGGDYVEPDIDAA